MFTRVAAAHDRLQQAVAELRAITDSAAGDELYSVHHRLIHHSGWDARIVDGRPEFIPPGWIDPLRRPRRTPDPHPAVDLSSRAGPTATAAPDATAPSPTTAGAATSATTGHDTASRDPVAPSVTAAPIVPTRRMRPSPRDPRYVSFDDLDSTAADLELGAPTTRVVDFDGAGACASVSASGARCRPRL